MVANLFPGNQSNKIEKMAQFIFEYNTIFYILLIIYVDMYLLSLIH